MQVMAERSVRTQPETYLGDALVTTGGSAA